MGKTQRSSGLILSCGQLATYVTYRCLEFGIGMLPLSWCWNLGTLVGAVAYYLGNSYRRLALRNLSIAFDGEKQAEEILRLTKKHFRTLGRNFFCSIKIAQMPTDAVEQCISYEGREHIIQACEAGKGVITTIAHLSNWEILSQVPSLGPGIPRSTLYQRLSNPYLNDLIVRRRRKSGLTLFDRSSGFYGPLKHLRDGGGVGILIDQHAGDRGVWCPLFGRLASTTNLPALLAQRTGAAIIPVGVRSDRPGHWVITYSAPVTTAEEIRRPHQKINDITAQLNQALENFIRKAPEEWFWVHDRWKTPNPRFLLSNYHRGIWAGDLKQLKPFRVIVRSPNPLGDACMAVPAIRALKKGRPDLELTMHCRENLLSFWQAVAEIDHVLTTPRSAKPWQVAKVVRQQSRFFEAALLFPNSARSAIEYFLAGIPRIVGNRGHFRSWLLHQIPQAPKKFTAPPPHHAYSYLEVIRQMGADTQDASLFDFPAPQKTKPSPQAPLKLGICPGAEYGAAKRWPIERFAQVAQLAYEKFQSDCIVIGSPAEKAIGEQFEQLYSAPGCRNLVGKTTITEMIDELKQCDLLLTNDTGTMHLAAFLGIPTVSIFGSTEPALTSPLGKGHRIIRRHVACSPCFLRECPLDFRCMTEASVAEVSEAVLKTMNECRDESHSPA
ncbi:MAG: lipopolysaccharide heptosyltransferase II [Verrucomicrobiales bacterium]|nr:lipopolysaccharide heptosyltransferase II [Verrucomicrobiales bacterium]